MATKMLDHDDSLLTITGRGVDALFDEKRGILAKITNTKDYIKKISGWGDAAELGAKVKSTASAFMNQLKKISAFVGEFFSAFMEPLNTAFAEFSKNSITDSMLTGIYNIAREFGKKFGIDAPIKPGDKGKGKDLPSFYTGTPWNASLWEALGGKSEPAYGIGV